MAWFKVVDGRIVYSGRISRDPHAAWLGTKQGTLAAAERAKTLGFRLFGRARAARKLLWRELDEAARSAEGRTAMQAAADLYIRSISTHAYAQGLPRLTVGLRRIVLVPRALAAGRARPQVRARLAECRAFSASPLAVQEFLFERALVEIDAAARSARPSVQRAIASSDEWSLIGADTQFQWVDQLWSGAGWTGHWFVYELPRTPLARADRKAVEQAVASLHRSVATLPRDRRHALIKLAAS